MQLVPLRTGTTMLVSVRFLAGLSSPLVASLLYILERARDKMHALVGLFKAVEFSGPIALESARFGDSTLEPVK
jgi:hypothetical protein